MPRGGARVNSGPPPDPNSLRQDPATWTHLPEDGRSGDPPAWPLSRPKTRELTLWLEEWRRPQAVMWELQGRALEVALFVRAVAVAESGRATAADRGLVLRQMAELGLTSGGLARNRWIIGARAPEAKEPRRADGPDRTSAKARFRTLEGGAAS